MGKGGHLTFVLRLAFEKSTVIGPSCMNTIQFRRPRNLIRPIVPGGAGKSTVGLVLANRMDTPHVCPGQCATSVLSGRYESDAPASRCQVASSSSRNLIPAQKAKRTSTSRCFSSGMGISAIKEQSLIVHVDHGGRLPVS
jgi:hypothetical protein